MPGMQAAFAHRVHETCRPAASETNCAVKGLGWLPVRNIVLLTALVCNRHKNHTRQKG